MDLSKEFIELGNGTLKLTIKDFSGELRTDYAVITEPPLFADMGTFRGILNKTNFMVNMSAEYDYETGHVKAIVSDFDIFLEPVLGLFDGYSDVFDRLGTLGTFAANVGIDRLNSMSAYMSNDRV